MSRCDFHYPPFAVGHFFTEDFSHVFNVADVLSLSYFYDKLQGKNTEPKKPNSMKHRIRHFKYKFIKLVLCIDNQILILLH